jgi:hypothetical protein
MQNRRMYGFSEGEKNHPVLWVFFCVFLILVTFGLAGLALIISKIPVRETNIERNNKEWLENL